MRWNIFLTAFNAFRTKIHRISYKNSPHFLQMAWDKMARWVWWHWLKWNWVNCPDTVKNQSLYNYANYKFSCHFFIVNSNDQNIRYQKAKNHQKHPPIEFYNNYNLFFKNTKTFKKTKIPIHIDTTFFDLKKDEKLENTYAKRLFPTDLGRFFCKTWRFLQVVKSVSGNRKNF